MNNLQRMLVIPPTLFEKWRELILEDKHLTDLDLKMKKIIKLKNVPTGKKWYLYRQQLMMEANRRRNKPYLEQNDVERKKTKKNISLTVANNKTVDNKNRQFGRKSTYSEIVSLLNNNNNNDDDNNNNNNTFGNFDDEDVKNNFILPIEDDFQKQARFSSILDDNDNIESDNLYNLDEDIFSSTAKNESGLNTSKSINRSEYDMDNVVRSLALEGVDKNVRIVKERRSLNPKEYKAFELSDGTQVTVPIPSTSSGLQTKKPQKKKKTTPRQTRSRTRLTEEDVEEQTRKELSFQKRKKKIAERQKQYMDKLKNKKQSGSGPFKWTVLR